MKKRDLSWTREASNDLISIFNYVGKDSIDTASKVLDKINIEVLKLKEYGKIGRHIPEINLINARELIVYNFRVMYLIEDKEIHIVAIYHTAQNFTKDMLNDKL
jgi:addiction module RelE/StbE family toxin